MLWGGKISALNGKRKNFSNDSIQFFNGFPSGSAADTLTFDVILGII
jgi:hypothetical protein